MEELSALKTKLEELKEQISSDEQEKVSNQQKRISEVWVKLNDVVSHLSPEQIAYVNSNKELINKKAELNGVFNEWLFEKYKNEFTQIPQFEAIAREYVNCVEKTSHEYIESAQTIMTENEQLRSELEALKKQLSEFQVKSKEDNSMNEVLL